MTITVKGVFHLCPICGQDHPRPTLWTAVVDPKTDRRTSQNQAIALMATDLELNQRQIVFVRQEMGSGQIRWSLIAIPKCLEGRKIPQRKSPILIAQCWHLMAQLEQAEAGFSQPLLTSQSLQSFPRIIGVRADGKETIQLAMGPKEARIMAALYPGAMGKTGKTATFPLNQLPFRRWEVPKLWMALWAFYLDGKQAVIVHTLPRLPINLTKVSPGLVHWHLKDIAKIIQEKIKQG